MPPSSQQTSQSTGLSQGFSNSGTQIVPGILGVYQDLLNRNQQNYSNILGAYSNGISAVGQQLPGITQGYGQLFGNVRDTLGLSGGGWGVATPAAQAIQRTYAQGSGAATQGLVSRGLGNTTVAASLHRGLARDAAQAYGGLGAQLAQTAAGYQAQLGGQALAARMQGLGQQVGLTQALGGQLAGYHFANTAGNLLGGYSNSQNTSQQSSTSRGTSSSPGGYGGGGAGGSPTSGLTPSQLLGGSGIHNGGGYGPGVGYSPGYGAPSYGAPSQGQSLGAPGGYSAPSIDELDLLMGGNDYFGGGGSLGGIETSLM